MNWNWCLSVKSLAIVALLFLRAQYGLAGDDLSAGAAPTTIHVAILEGPGVGGSCNQLIKAIEEYPKGSFEIRRLAIGDVQNGVPEEFDVLIAPGGSGGKQGKALGHTGRDAVRQFVLEGGGYLGVCAGAYLATNDYSWSLNLIDAKVVDRRHWARGSGSVKLELSPAGKNYFGAEQSEMHIHYAQGPLLARREWDDPKVPDYESLAVFASEIAKNQAPQGIMIGNSAAVRAKYGNGRVFCFSPHPELTDGLHQLIPITLQWLADAGNTSP